MQDEASITITPGFVPEHRANAAELFWSAFKDKLQKVMGPEDKALDFLTGVADPDHAISALDGEQNLLGIAGYKTTNGSFIGGGIGDLARVYGWFGGSWRGLFLATLERPIKKGTLLMDGIFVAPDARGHGVGTALLSAIKQKARSLGCKDVRLDVIDTNPRARALYERQGFVAQDTTDIGPLRHLFGFRRSTTMVCDLPDLPQ